MKIMLKLIVMTTVIFIAGMSIGMLFLYDTSPDSQKLIFGENYHSDLIMIYPEHLESH